MADSEWTVERDAAGLRLDKFLARADRIGSRARAVAALERGKVFLNGTCHNFIPVFTRTYGH